MPTVPSVPVKPAFVVTLLGLVGLVIAGASSSRASFEHPGAPNPAARLEAGRRLIVEAGCLTCHEISGFDGVVSRGPVLDGTGGKIRPEWLRTWLRDPQAHVPGSKMVDFRLGAEEIGQLEAFLLSQREHAPAATAGVNWDTADTEAGRMLFDKLRCAGCHTAGKNGAPATAALTGVGDKVRRDWLFGLLKDPSRTQPGTPMMRYALSDAEIRDLAAFLLETYRSPRTTEDLPLVAVQDARAATQGRVIFEQRGCNGCHRVAGVHESERIGPSLVDVAARHPIAFATRGYIYWKLRWPQTLAQRSRMPTFGFTWNEAADISHALVNTRLTNPAGSPAPIGKE